MPEQVMEQIGFGDVIDLIGPADPPGHREAPVGQVIEEIQLRQQALHADQGPAGGCLQHAIERIEARDVRLAHAHRILRLQELLAGATDQQLALAPIQGAPGGVVVGAVAVPRLLHHRSGVDRDIALVGELVFDALRSGSHAAAPPGDQASP